MTLPWKKGPPPEGEVGEWLVWIEFYGARFARRDARQRLFVLDPSGNHPPSWWEGRITHHLPEKITPPGEAPALPSPREGKEGREAKDLYYLQDSRGYVGNAVSWWRAGRSGYTCDPREAHVFTREGALRAHRTRCSDVPWPKDYVDSLVSTMVDAQRLDHGMALKEDSP